MKSLSISPEKLLTLIIGKPINLETSFRGQLLLSSIKNQETNLPSEMAGAIAEIDHNGQVNFVSLVHPFAINHHETLFDIEDNRIHREPYNWFGPQALVIEKKMKDFAHHYDGPVTDDGAIPRQYIPDNIAEPIILSDKYWQDYAQFVNDPDGSFAKQIKPMFNIK
ncbi:hypothetical protein GCM10025879_04860 [Leuconostoc litchii]|uniref:Uncharacterized protein n=1 Tax=Leuconostoc litchii TaxID=1981069 RepID=A0A6P2CMK3_9LACO|nr:hypothetical protein [Leuconostoc litchii]TYC47255.1 hypothetical protein ESZ47_03710 [Leuconostoc litchii]GMA69240.1 hypothetical protein GCM10025879_04860 [Leuconostoc litchii]